jgi:outer membrane immunogenic protein
MKKFGLALLAAGAAMQFAPLSQPALAADLGGGSLKDTPYVAVPYWGGFYFGGHAGGAWGNTKVHDQFDYVGDPIYNFSANSTNFIGGAQAGYNIQRGRLVFGVEGDIGYLNISANGSKHFTPNSCTAHYGPHDSITYHGHLCEVYGKYSTSSDLYADLTGRLGYAAGRALFYAKGGVALLNAELKSSYKGGNAGADGWHTFDFSHSDTLVGWTVGAGVEYALTPAWSLKAEYQHFDFGTMSPSYSDCYAIPGHGTSCPAPGSQYSNHWTSTITGKSDVSVTADAVKLGVNYHVGK